MRTDEERRDRVEELACIIFDAIFKSVPDGQEDARKLVIYALISATAQGYVLYSERDYLRDHIMDISAAIIRGMEKVAKDLDPANN